MLLKKLNLAFIIIALVVILAACESSQSTVTDLEDPIVESVLLNDQFNFDYDTSSQEVINSLPDTTEVQFSDGSTETFNIDWTAPSDFSATTPGSYIFTADIIDIPREVEVEVIIESEASDDDGSDETGDTGGGDDDTGDGDDEDDNDADDDEEDAITPEFSEIRLLTTEVLQGDKVIVDLEGFDQDGNPWNEKYWGSLIIQTAGSYIDTVNDINFVDGIAKGVEFDIDTTDLEPGIYDVTLIGGGLFDGVNQETSLEIIGGPEVLDLITTNQGSTAIAYVGSGGLEQGRIKIETVALGQSTNDWEVKVVRQSSASNLHVDVNVSQKVITIDLDTGISGIVNPLSNSAGAIADLIESSGFFTTSVISTGLISFQEEKSFSGGENIELEITWDQPVNRGSNNADFNLDGSQAFFANTINGTSLTTIAFDNFDKISSGDEIEIKRAAVTSVDTLLENSEITFQWNDNINNWQ